MTRIEEELTKKRYWLWLLMSLLTLASLCNLLLSITIIAVLRVNRGMESIQVLPEEHLIKLHGRTDFDGVKLERGVCEGYGDVPFEATADGEGAGVSIGSFGSSGSSTLEIRPSGLTVSRSSSFEVKDPATGIAHFSTDQPHFGLPAGVGKIELKIAKSRRIVAPLNGNLAISSDLGVTMHGAEGAKIDAKQIRLRAGSRNNGTLLLRSINGSIVLEGSQGILLDPTLLPIAPPGFFVGSSATGRQYKLCVCMPQGKLFRVPLTNDTDHFDRCARVDRAAEKDPCLR